MNITLLNVVSAGKECLNKDVMGGYGEATTIGNSFLAKILERAKKRTVKLPVFSLAYLSSIFTNNGHNVRVTENNVPLDSDLVIIPSSIVDYKAELSKAKWIKENTKAKVGFIGPFASVKPDIFLKVADFVIEGEPESIAIKISDKNIPKGVVKSKPIQDLDKLPYPRWDLFPIYEYSYYPVIKKKPFLPILSSRGCAYNCNYCPYKVQYEGHRQRSVDNIVKEIEYIVNKFKVKGVLFRDPLFTLNKERAMQISKEIIKRNIKIEWACETHFNCIDKPLIDIMYESGLRSINLGIESSNENILRKATRINASKNHQDEMVEYCDKKGIKVSAFYIFGLPDDTIKTIKDTIKYSKKLNTHIAQFFVSTPFPGTKYYEQIKDKIFESDWEKFNSFTPVFSHKNLTSQQLLKLKEQAFVGYYFRPKYLLKYVQRMYLQ